MTRYPKAHRSIFRDRCVRSRRIEQAGKLALVIVANLAGQERAFALAQQQERGRRHPHDFVGRYKPPRRDMRADAFRGIGAIFTQPVARDMLRVAYSNVVSPIVRESMSAVA